MKPNYELQILAICYLLLATCFCFAQKVHLLNLPNYDKEKLHFGFSLGVNKAYFVLYPADATTNPDSILSVGSIPDWGFNLGIISDLRLYDYATLRFMPALTFQDRALEYQIDSTTVPGTNAFYTVKKKVESTLLDFPINLKIRSERLNNTSAYLLAGGKFSIDLASQAKTKNPDLIKLNNKDWNLEAGFGLDFYLEYFKLSAEIKFAAGLNDRLHHENTAYSSPIKKTFTKTWLFSLNFEG
ncbi:MAG: porin family protein [Bacteroidota bacterium]